MRIPSPIFSIVDLTIQSPNAVGRLKKACQAHLIDFGSQGDTAGS
jgi:hypothetical protein